MIILKANSSQLILRFSYSYLGSSNFVKPNLSENLCFCFFLLLDFWIFIKFLLGLLFLFDIPANFLCSFSCNCKFTVLQLHFGFNRRYLDLPWNCECVYIGKNWRNLWNRFIIINEFLNRKICTIKFFNLHNAYFSKPVMLDLCIIQVMKLLMHLVNMHLFHKSFAVHVS